MMTLLWHILLWALMFIPELLVKVMCVFLAPLVALFIRSEERTDRVKQLDNQQHTLMRDYLIKPLYWFQTHDNAVDEWWFGAFNRSSVLAYFRNGTQAQYESSRFFRYACRVMWLWRNVGYGFAYNIFGRVLDDTLWVKERGVEDTGFWYKFTRRVSSFQLKAHIPTPWFWHLDINIGWKTHKGFPRAMYAGRLIGSGA